MPARTYRHRFLPDTDGYIGYAVSRLALLAIPCALLGCTVGPDYSAPQPSPTAGYLGQPAALPGAGGSDVRQRFDEGADLAGHWWKDLASPQLEDMLALALRDSPTLDTARATLAQARQAVLAARGGYYPQADLSAAAQRQRDVNRLGTVTENLFSIGPTVSYGPDIFGGVRRQVEAQTALAEFQRYELAAAYLTLTGNAVTQAINAASAREQIRAVDDVIAADRHNLELVQVARVAGKAADTDVLAAQTQLASDMTLLPPLRQQLSVAEDALAVLVGRTPGEWRAPAFDFGMLALPTTLPLAVPSALLQARPDILAAQAQLHAASAEIGVATAQLYPSITLSASWTQASPTMGALFNPGNEVWNVASGVTAPLFHGGTLQAQRQQAIEAYAAQLGLYRQTVLQAFGQVADILRALAHDAEAIEAQRTALDTAQRSLEISQESYRAGAASVLDVLQAQRLYAQAQLGYARARSQRYLDTVQLLLAMGGGWRDWAGED